MIRAIRLLFSLAWLIYGPVQACFGNELDDAGIYTFRMKSHKARQFEAIQFGHEAKSVNIAVNDRFGMTFGNMETTHIVVIKVKTKNKMDY